VTNNPPSAGDSDNETRQRIIAARAPVLHEVRPPAHDHGRHRRHGRIARPALYRYVSSRDEIIERVIIDRVEELGEGFRPLFEDATSFAEAFVAVSLAAVNAARLDPNLQALFETTTGSRIVQVMAGPSTGAESGFHDFVKGFFKDAFAAARASGELRTDVSDDAMVEWIRGVYMMMILREDLDGEREKEMIVSFLLRSLLPGHPTIDITEPRSQLTAPKALRRKAPTTRRARS